MTCSEAEITKRNREPSRGVILDVSRCARKAVFQTAVILIAKATKVFTFKLLLILPALCAMSLQAQSSASLTDQQKLAEAATLARQHRFTDAQQIIEGVPVPSEPARAIAFHRLRAAINAGIQRPKESAEEMRAALALAPNDPALVKATGVAELVWLEAQLKTPSHPDLSTTIANIRRLQEKGLPDTGDIEALLGEAYEKLGDSVSSARCFQKAVELSPNEERFRLALAIELMQHQTYEPALVVLKRAGIDFPRSARIRTAIALTLYLSGEEKLGIRKLLETISLDPGFAPAVHYLEEIALNQGTTPEPGVVKAACDYADAHASDSEAAAYCGALEARVASDNAETADWTPILRRLGTAASRSPRNPLARCEYGKALYQTRDWPRARSELQACVHLDPDSIEGHYRLARVYEHYGEKDLARKELALRAAASSRLAAINDAREESVKGFLYTMGQR